MRDCTNAELHEAKKLLNSILHYCHMLKKMLYLLFKVTLLSPVDLFFGNFYHYWVLSEVLEMVIEDEFLLM